jgi:hypothetical protein
MLGRYDRQTSFSEYWLENKIPKNSCLHKMHDWIMNNLSGDIKQK